MHRYDVVIHSLARADRLCAALSRFQVSRYSVCPQHDTVQGCCFVCSCGEAPLRLLALGSTPRWACLWVSDFHLQTTMKEIRYESAAGELANSAIACTARNARSQISTCAHIVSWRVANGIAPHHSTQLRRCTLLYVLCLAVCLWMYVCTMLSSLQSTYSAPYNPSSHSPWGSAYPTLPVKCIPCGKRRTPHARGTHSRRRLYCKYTQWHCRSDATPLCLQDSMHVSPARPAPLTPCSEGRETLPWRKTFTVIVPQAHIQDAVHTPP